MTCIASSSRNIALKASSEVLRPRLTNVKITRPAIDFLALGSSHSSQKSRPLQSRSFFSLPDIHKLAGLVTPGSEEIKEESGVQTEGEVQKFHARKILPYSQAQLYALVSDVPSYSSFIPFCTSSRVLAPGSITSSSNPSKIERYRETQNWKPDENPFDVEAELKVGFGGLEETYVSRVVGQPYESVTATAAKQSPLFKSLRTTWSFSPASSISPHASSSTFPPTRPPPSGRIPNPTSPQDGPTLLNIDLAFSFANPLHRIASQAVLPKVAERMVEAFEKRCLEVFGKGKQ